MRSAQTTFALLLCLWSKLAFAQACPEATSPPQSEPLPLAWQSALDDLLIAASSEGALWSCSGALISLSVSPMEDSATLRVESPDGRIAERRVSSPNDLVPMGEAVLASSRRAAPPEALPARPTPRDDSPKPQPLAPAATEPRAVLRALVGARYAGPLRVLWGSGALAASIPFGDWAGGLWVRGDIPNWVIDEGSTDLAVTEIAVGLSLDRQFVLDPLILHVALEPSLAVVTMAGGAEPDLTEAGFVDERIGLALRAAWPLGEGTWRFVTCLDGEMAPSALGGTSGRSVDPGLAPVPSFTAGLSLGIERSVP